MMLFINGQRQDFNDNHNIADVINKLGLTGKRIAVEHNHEIVPFDQYQSRIVHDGDKLEIVHAIGGGQAEGVLQTSDDTFTVAGKAYKSRLLVGTGKYKDLEETRLAIEASGAEIVTVAIRRSNIGQKPDEPNLLDVISPDKYTILPNTAGCYTIDEAIRTCRLARELLGGHNLVKLEVLADQKTLFPDVEQTIVAAGLLVKEGFDVMVYTNDDPIAAKRLEEIGCVAVMPLAAPIGSGLGIRNPYNILTIVENANVPILVDAGVGTASDAAIAMELGCAGVLMNTAIAEAKNPVLMASAMRKGIEAGREAYLAGRMPRRRFASASSPVDGLFF
jgi:thiazole synthase